MPKRPPLLQDPLQQVSAPEHVPRSGTQQIPPMSQLSPLSLQTEPAQQRSMLPPQTAQMSELLQTKPELHTEPVQQ